MQNSLTLAAVRDWKEAVEADPVARHVNRDDLLALLDLAEAQLQSRETRRQFALSDAEARARGENLDGSLRREAVPYDNNPDSPPVNEGE